MINCHCPRGAGKTTLYYQELAKRAAQYEREGNYHMAMIMWQHATEAATSQENKTYAENRADFCGRWGNDD